MGKIHLAGLILVSDLAHLPTDKRQKALEARCQKAHWLYDNDIIGDVFIADDNPNSNGPLGKSVALLLEGDFNFRYDDAHYLPEEWEVAGAKTNAEEVSIFHRELVKRNEYPTYWVACSWYQAPRIWLEFLRHLRLVWLSPVWHWPSWQELRQEVKGWEQLFRFQWRK